MTPAARPAVVKIAENCFYGKRQLLGSLPAGLLLDVTFLSAPPWEVEPWKTIAAENNPGQATTPAPILVVQGTADTIVDPNLTAQLATKLCAAGETVELRTYDGVSHLDTGKVAVPDVLQWINDRSAGKQPIGTYC